MREIVLRTLFVSLFFYPIPPRQASHSIWINDVLFGEIIPPAVESGLDAMGISGWLQSLILDGIVAGVGAVLGTIENDRDRKMTIMTTTFILCGAKLPIIALVAGAFFGNLSKKLA